MMIAVVGCSFRDTPIQLRERLAFDPATLERTLDEIAQRFQCEAIILNTCNRVEIYLGWEGDRPEPDCNQLVKLLAEVHNLQPEVIAPHLYQYLGEAAVRHLLRVASGLDSLILGEGQIAGQVREAYEKARLRQCLGPVLNSLFQHALRTAKRVRTETAITRGKVSVSSAAVAFVCQVFSRFDDKIVLVIGAGKMGVLTLRSLRTLSPKQILVTNRSWDKALAVANSCGGTAVPWEQLDEVLALADIVLSTTGAPEPVVTVARYQKILARRTRGSLVILDIAVPRDFDPTIHDGDRTCLFNIDDLNRIRDQTLEERRKHLVPAEALVEEQTRVMLQEWTRRRNGPVIKRLTQDFELKRQAVEGQLLTRLNGRLSEGEKKYIQGAFRLLQNQILHGPIRALAEESNRVQTLGARHTLHDAVCKLFQLQE